MLPIAALKENLELAISKEVLPKFDGQLNLTGLICYGSRVTGGARQNSDFDMMAIVETLDGSEFYGEFHGTLCLNEKAVPVEIRIYSLEKLKSVLVGEDPKRLYALQRSHIVLDKLGGLQDFRNAAAEKYAELIQEFKVDLQSLKSAEILPILQITASEQYRIAQHLIATKQSAAALLGFFEFLTDYLVCVEGCLSQKSNFPSDENCISNLYFLRSEKGGRFFNIEKYPWPKRYEELIRNLNASLMSSVFSLETAFLSLDRHFQDLFDIPLILAEDKWPSVCLN